MAWTARCDEEKKEFMDSPEELQKKVDRLAEWFRKSKHTIAFTGAGISTSAGIPDFRSGMDTVLETGPGAWELRAKGQWRDERKYKVTSTSKAIPTITHMSLVKLHEEGLLKCVVSQNCDGLHRRSGMPSNGVLKFSALYELHGNSNVEKCSKCGRDYLRDFSVRTAHGVFQHRTGQRCDDPKCRGELEDTIINFGEQLPQDTILASFDHAIKAELCLAMGSSLTVTPAADVPRTVGERGQRLVVVNLQRTPLDHLCALRIFAKTDDVARMLMEKLGLEVPEFRLRRSLILKTVKKGGGQVEVTVSGADKNGHPFSYLYQVIMTSEGRTVTCPKEPFVATVPVKEGGGVAVEVGFHAHYGEPPLKLSVHLDVPVEMVDISFNPFTHQWTVSRDEDVGSVAGTMAAATI